MWFLLLAACSEYDFNGRPDDVVAPSCEQPDFGVDLPDLLDECAGEPQIGTFVPTPEWTWTTNPISPGFHQIMSTPAVADVSGDGVPDVVFTAFAGSAYGSAGALVCVSGADGSTLWSVTSVGGASPYASSGVAIADLDGDGAPTVIVSATTGLLAVDRTGAFEWLAAVPVSAYGHPAVGEMDGDGLSEVVYGRSVVEHDGTVRWTGTGGTGGGAYMSFPADLDQDGLSEVVAGNTVYEHDGSVRWNDGGPDGFPAIADLDLDGSPEIVRVGGGKVRAARADGSLLWDFAITDGGGGPPTIADFDGDGAPEIGVASRSVYRVIESNGTERWHNTVQDYSSSVTGSSVFDFEGDGAAEVVYADEQTLWVYDGASGTVEMAWDSHSSGTLYEYPLVVDVDADGATEIVVASNDYAYAGSRGITVIGDQADSWAPARAVWNQHAYSITNVDDDGTSPSPALPSWEHWNSFRAGNSQTAVGLDQPDLVVGDVDVCTHQCDENDVVVYVPVSNRGQADANDVRVEIYAVADDGPVLRGAMEIATLVPGDAAWVGPFALATEGGESEFKVIVRTALGNECDQTNNSVTLTGLGCGSAD